MKKIIILDFSTAEVHIFPYDDNVYSDGEEFIQRMNDIDELICKVQDCQWMITDDLNIQIH